MTINSVLLDSIENELIQNNQSPYQKVIPIKNYSYATKKTLDYLIDKYGGFINRYDDKVIIFINDSIISKNKSITKANDEKRYVSLRFEKINTSINNFNDRLSVIEEKVSHLVDQQNKHITHQNKNLQSYLSYFRTKEDKKEAKRLIEEIINHH